MSHDRFIQREQAVLPEHAPLPRPGQRPLGLRRLGAPRGRGPRPGR